MIIAKLMHFGFKSAGLDPEVNKLYVNAG